jgi:pimeloyl-ACP methyl ester carboxylesterase
MLSDSVNVSSTAPDPVIIIPGILGSEKNSDGMWVIDPILHTYDDLIATLDINHYTLGVDLFTFPYNWRKSNVETAVLLKQKIDEVKEICNCDKVDLVAHSMGGLVARQYIQSDAYQQDVDQLIFLGTPHLGAPKAYLMWEGGEIGPLLPISGTLTEKVLEQEAIEKGYANLFTYIHNEPISSVQELLPVYDYIFDGNTVRQYPSNYPTNIFLEDLNNNINQLLDSDVRIYNFIGETGGQETLNGIQAVQTAQYTPMWQHGYPENYYDSFGNHGLIFGTGDATVPTGSASFVNSNLTTTQYVHSALPAGTEGDAYQILTGETAAMFSHKYDSTPKKVLHILMHSPADLFVVDPEGKKIGKENGQAINQIPDAFYTGFNTDTEYITILNPLGGEYKIFTEGTASGAYTVETTYTSEATTTEASFTGNTTLGLVTELDVSVNNENPEELGIGPTDTEPPAITIESPEARDYLRSEQLSVDVSAQDISGVFALETTLGTATVPNTGTVDLFYHTLGSYALTASSTDNVGNATTSTRVFRVVATPDSTLSDIERAHRLGWMIQSVRDKLIDKLQTYVEKLQQSQKADKFILKDILNELEKRRWKGLNEQGYQLLKEDILWLINN